jgi:hypothetical protein|mmetsp:Transcript_105496/g.166540  ORF Transcript_105496/g.166540 Transcript_105496/m.166540 type:complete len:128 (+) Transcript_105496:443-826(+)
MYLSIRLNRLTHRQQKGHLTQARKNRISPKREFIGLPHYEKIEQVITATTMDYKKHHKVHNLHKMRTCEVDQGVFCKEAGYLIAKSQNTDANVSTKIRNAAWVKKLASNLRNKLARQVSFCAKTANC